MVYINISVNLLLFGFLMFVFVHSFNHSSYFIGLLTAVHKDYFRVVNSRDLLFNDCGDRVAQLLHVELVPPYSQYDAHQEVLIVNTHLLFPHDSTLSIVRLQQVEFCFKS